MTDDQMPYEPKTDDQGRTIPCYECGDRVIIRPNDALRDLMRRTDSYYLEFDTPFVLITPDGLDAELEVTGDPGDCIIWDPMTDAFSVKVEAPC